MARHHAASARELAHRSIGVIGAGHVGRAVAAIAAGGFGMMVLAYHPRANTLSPPFRQVGLAELAERSDIVVVCCPLTPETENLIDERFLARMPPTSVLINVARGPVVSESALLAALREERIAGAALDVFWEHPLRADHPLFEFTNVILTPHLAGVTDDSMARMGMGTSLRRYACSLASYP